MRYLVPIVLFLLVIGIVATVGVGGVLDYIAAGWNAITTVGDDTP